MVPVIQADREAAAQAGRAASRLTRRDAEEIVAGNWDDWRDVQAFARHRIAGQAELVNLVPDDIELFRLIRAAGRSNVGKMKAVDRALQPLRVPPGR